MAVSEKQKEYSKKYIEKLDEFKIRLPKGYKKRIKDHADERGESVNAFFKRAAEETMANDKNK